MELPRKKGGTHGARRTLDELLDQYDKVVRYFLRLELRAVEQDWCSANHPKHHLGCGVVKLKA